MAAQGGSAGYPEKNAPCPGAGFDENGYPTGDGYNGAYPWPDGFVPAGSAGQAGGTPSPAAKAAPEDLKKVRSMWKNIIAETSPAFRMALASAQVKYNAGDENDNRLFVVFTDFLAERKAELEGIIADKIGKQVEVKLMLEAEEDIQKNKLAEIDLDERIREFIHTDIEIVDEN